LARRGVLLLEALLALAVFIMTGIAILSLVERTTRSLVQARHSAQAADLARSVVAMMEAGIGTPRTLNGPVRPWAEAQARADERAFGMGGPVQPHQSPWEVRIDVTPSQFQGLTLVTVHALRRAGRNSDRMMASYTLRQLIRLGEAAEERVEEDALLDEARRGLRELERGQGRGSP
jgi:HAMP domain-containing protein